MDLRFNMGGYCTDCRQTVLRGIGDCLPFGNFAKNSPPCNF
jgi:hypothetical protein